MLNNGVTIGFIFFIKIASCFHINDGDSILNNDDYYGMFSKN